MIYSVNGKMRLLFTEKSISDNVTEAKEQTKWNCKKNGKKLAA